MEAEKRAIRQQDLVGMHNIDPRPHMQCAQTLLRSFPSHLVNQTASRRKGSKIEKKKKKVEQIKTRV